MPTSSPEEIIALKKKSAVSSSPRAPFRAQFLVTLQDAVLTHRPTDTGLNASGRLPVCSTGRPSVHARSCTVWCSSPRREGCGVAWSDPRSRRAPVCGLSSYGAMIFSAAPPVASEVKGITSIRRVRWITGGGLFGAWVAQSPTGAASTGRAARSKARWRVAAEATRFKLLRKSQRESEPSDVGCSFVDRLQDLAEEGGVPATLFEDCQQTTSSPVQIAGGPSSVLAPCKHVRLVENLSRRPDHPVARAGRRREAGSSTNGPTCPRLALIGPVAER